MLKEAVPEIRVLLSLTERICSLMWVGILQIHIALMREGK
jgi:hypothetical protein